LVIAIISVLPDSNQLAFASGLMLACGGKNGGTSIPLNS